LRVLKSYYKIIVSLAVILGVINISLAIVGQSNAVTYFVASTIAYLACSLYLGNLYPQTKIAVNIIGVMIFIGFSVIVGLKIISVLQ
jgi:hypothetical protein